MNYIVIDMEWNQPFCKSNIHYKNGTAIFGEIIQIGAVKLNSEKEIIDTFKIEIKPRHYTILNRKVKEITKFSQKKMNAGIDIHVAVKKFIKWCGEDFEFISWGYDDLPMLESNLKFYKIDCSWLPVCYNAQIFFNQQTKNTGRQFSLEYAVNYYEIESDKDLHDAMNDAYYTALVCQKLDIDYGKKEYYDILDGKLVIKESYRAVKLSSVVTAYDSSYFKKEKKTFLCHVCNEKIQVKDTINYSKNKRYFYCVCENHGEFVVMTKVIKGRNKNLRLLKSVYKVESENLEEIIKDYKTALELEKTEKEQTENV